MGWLCHRLWKSGRHLLPLRQIKRTPKSIKQTTLATMNIVQIVRRYGPVGGMERYVWELSKELALLGHQVTVLCESCLADAPKNIQVIELGKVREKPRWIAHLRFSKRVSGWIAANPQPQRIIHSHERTNAHHFTTFHGPPFAQVKDKVWWKRISPRIMANLYLERRELCGGQVKVIIPNSMLIAERLRHYYPEISGRIIEPITPGVVAIPQRPDRAVVADAGVIGFVGKEWKRKGLDIAVKVISELRRQRPNLEFIVAGPKPDEIRHLFNDWQGGFQLLGETDSTPLYARFDLLLHPARQEPYGMVIAEARAAAVPVLVSDACGIAAELNETSVLSINDPISDWSTACAQLIGQTTKSIRRDWATVAQEQITCYQRFF
ncbi:glycosyltransferase family 4 protein [Mariprofundus ferrooxydans]|nr:glycosyltransferase family 4 protein [Mariprofundus ferrooxydans]